MMIDLVYTDSGSRMPISATTSPKREVAALNAFGVMPPRAADSNTDTPEPIIATVQGKGASTIAAMPTTDIQETAQGRSMAQ